MIRNLLASLLLLVLPTALLAGPPQPFTMEFDAYWGDTDIGDIRMELTRSGDNQYRLLSTSEAEGLASLYKRGVQEEESLFAWQPTGQFRERSYESRNIRDRLFGGTKTEVEIRANFSWPAGQVEFSEDGETKRFQAPPGTTDRQLLPFSLGAWVAENPPSADTPINIHFADDHKLRRYEFHYKGEEVLDTSVGKLRTQRFERDSGRRLTIIWIAVDHGYLPVRFDKLKHGDTRLSTRIRRLDTGARASR